MKAFEIRDSFGLDHLTLGERPEPVPAPGHALVRLRAVSLNFRDLLMVRGLYNPKQPLPLVPLSDGAGEVAGVGVDSRNHVFVFHRGIQIGSKVGD